MDSVTIVFPILAVLSVVFLILLKIYFKIREYLPISVNCWFCNDYSKVAYLEYNSWVCKKCGQYNGFTEDGDYNRPIAAQYDEFLNVPAMCTPRSKYKRQSPALCRNCNLSQQLKISRLASFIPLDPNNYDAEVDIYSEQLNKLYEICKQCENVLANMIEKERTSFSSGYKNSNVSSTKTKRSKKWSKGVRFLSICTVIGCGVQVIFAICQQDVVKVYATVLYKLYIVRNMPFTIDSWLNDNQLLERVSLLYHEHVWLISVASICICLLVFLIKFMASRCVVNFLNVSVWIILLGLKYFATDVDNKIVILQGVTAAVFLCVSKRRRISRDKIVIKRLARPVVKTEVSPKSVKVTHPVPAPVNNDLHVLRNMSFMNRENVRESMEVKGSVSESDAVKDSVSKVLEMENALYKSSSIDVGISSLYLGTRNRTNVKNHLTSDPPSYYNRSNDYIWNHRSGILSPSKLNVDVGRFVDETSPTRCSSRTSGVGSLSSTQPQEVAGLVEREFDRFSESPGFNNQMLPTYFSPYEPMYQPIPTPYAYYQFAAMCQRMYTPPSSPDSLNSSGTNRVLEQHPKTQCSHNMLYSMSITMLLLCNFMLMGFMMYKEFMIKV